MPTTPGERVGAARRALGISQERLARVADCSTGTINAIEANRRDPRIDLKLRIARALRQDPNFLFALPVDDLDGRFPPAVGASDEGDASCMDAQPAPAAVTDRGGSPLMDDQRATDGAPQAVA